MCCVVFMKDAKKLYVAADSLFNLPYVDGKTEEAIHLVTREDGAMIEEEMETLHRENKEQAQWTAAACDANETLATIIEQSPFTRYFKEALQEDECNCRNQDGEEDNSYFSPGSFKIITSVIHLLPLWSSVMSSVEESLEEIDPPLAVPCYSNALVESHFKTVKHGIVRGRKRLRPRQYLCKNLTYIQGKLNESKLPRRASRKAQKNETTAAADISETWKRGQIKKRKYSDPQIAKQIFRTKTSKHEKEKEAETRKQVMFHLKIG